MEPGHMEGIRKSVREHYGKTAKQEVSNCGGGTKAPCCRDTSNLVEKLSTTMGYSKEELRSVPEGSNLGLGCGNPQAIASLKPGENVLDLGSGGGFDCFLTAGKVGSAWKVIGVDMTPEMLAKARTNENP